MTIINLIKFNNVKQLIKAELINLKENGKAIQSYKQKLNRLLDSREISFEAWQKTGTFCKGSRMEKLYNRTNLTDNVLRYAGGILILCTEDSHGKPNYTFETEQASELKDIEQVVWQIINKK